MTEKKKTVKKAAAKKTKKIAVKKTVDKKSTSPYISIVITVYNEEGNLLKLIEELKEPLSVYDYEVIFVDDGSSDGSLEILKSNRSKNKRLKILQFGANYGQHAAHAAGLRVAKGEIIVLIDSDLQNDPADIPRFVSEIEDNGMAAVFGWRVNRENNFILRQLPSKIFNWVRNRNLSRPLHDYGCALNAFRREFVDELIDKPDYLKHITTYIAAKKVPITEVKINERERYSGVSHYNFIRLLQNALDLIIVSASKPIATALLAAVGAVSFLLSLFALLLFLPDWLFGEASFFDYIIYPYAFFMGGLACAVLALINERISSVLRQLNKKPLYIVKEYLD